MITDIRIENALHYEFGSKILTHTRPRGMLQRVHNIKFIIVFCDLIFLINRNNND